MGKRRSPYLTKPKAAKNKGNSYGVTDYTSQDIFNSTESNSLEPRYAYTADKYNNYKGFFTSDINDSTLFDTYSPKRKGSSESYTFDDNTTSGISYNDRKKRRNDLVYSLSANDYIYESPEKHNRISSFRYHDHSYPKAREKNRSRLTKDSDKPNYRNRFDESEQSVDIDRRYRSPRSRYYQDLIHEEPEKEFEYEQYFEKTRPKVGGSTKQRRQDKYDNERNEKQNKVLSTIPNKHKDYQVYAYQDPTQHKEVFKSKNQPGDLSFSSEVEIKTHEYPMLAFRDAKSGQKESDMVYLPIIVLDKKSGKSRPEKSTEEPIYQANKENFQIFAANLQEQNNIFQNFENLQKKDTTQQDFGIEGTSGMRYAGLFMGTIIDEAVESDLRNENFTNDIKEGQKMPYTTGKSPFTYQVDVDISPNEPTGSLKDTGKKSSYVKNSSVNDPLYDGYPVTKDYIKVSSSEQKRQCSLDPPINREENKMNSVVSEEKRSKTIKEEQRTPLSIKLIDDETIARSIAKSKEVPATKSIIRNLSQDQPSDRELSSFRQSVAVGIKVKPTASKLSVLNEKSTNDLKTKSIRTESPHRHSVAKNSKVTSSGFADRKSMVSDKLSGKPVSRQSKVQTAPWTPLSPGFSNRKSVVASQDKKSTVAQMAVTPTPSSQNMRVSQAQKTKSALEDRRSHSASSPIPDHHKSVTHRQQSRKSAVAPSLAHHNTHIVAENVDELPQKIDVEDDSAKALRQFTKDVFNFDIKSQEKPTSNKSEQKKTSISKEKRTASVVHPSHDAESKHPSNKSAVGQPTNAPTQLHNPELAHERIGDSTAGIVEKPVEEDKKKPRSLMKTTSKIFTTLSKTGKKKSTEQAKPYIITGSPTGSNKSEGKAKPATTTQDNDDSQFVRSIEPTEAQYKKEQNKTQVLTKSKSKPDTKEPKDKKSLTRLFFRSKSKQRNESGDSNKKMRKSKSKSLLEILKRSKSSEMSVVCPAQNEETPAVDKQTVECECFANYIQNTRICAYFFLGTTLHELFMNIVKIYLGGN